MGKKYLCSIYASLKILNRISWIVLTGQIILIWKIYVRSTLKIGFWTQIMSVWHRWEKLIQCQRYKPHQSQENRLDYAENSTEHSLQKRQWQPKRIVFQKRSAMPLTSRFREGWNTLRQRKGMLQNFLLYLIDVVKSKKNMLMNSNR